jgi:hypothetical protein
MAVAAAVIEDECPAAEHAGFLSAGGCCSLAAGKAGAGYAPMVAGTMTLAQKSGGPSLSATLFTPASGRV